jgi:hypothetical protein
MTNNVFTTEFRYKGMTYSALISMRPSGADHAVFVQLNDRALHHVVPDGEFHFRISQGLRKAADPRSNVDHELLQSVREAVIRHIKPPTQVSDPY